MTTDDHQFDIAVIMPALNAEKHIGATLDQVYMQDYPMNRVQVIVADGGSTDSTRDIVGAFKGRFGSLKLLDNPRRLSSAGRNVGARNSNAKYILVLDSHTYLPSKTLLKDMVALFESSGAACLCRPQQLTPPDINEFEKSVALCHGSAFGHRRRSGMFADTEAQVDPTSSGAMYTRAVFEKVGAFDETFDACADVDFNFRVHQHGIKAWTSPKLTIFTYPRSSLDGLWRRMVRYGRGRFRLVQKHKLFSPSMSLVAAGVMGLALLLLVSFVSSWAASWFRTLIGLYMLLVVFFSGYLSQRHRHLGCLLYGPLIFPIVHFGLGAGFLYEMVRKLLDRQRRRTSGD